MGGGGVDQSVVDNVFESNGSIWYVHPSWKYVRRDLRIATIWFCGELVFEGGKHAHIGEDTGYWKAFFDGDREREVPNYSRRVDTTRIDVCPGLLLAK